MRSVIKALEDGLRLRDVFARYAGKARKRDLSGPRRGRAARSGEPEPELVLRMEQTVPGVLVRTRTRVVCLVVVVRDPPGVRRLMHAVGVDGDAVVEGEHHPERPRRQLRRLPVAAAADVVREELAHEEAELVDRQAPGAARALRPLLRPRPVPPRARSRVCLLHLELVVRLGRLLAAVLDPRKWLRRVLAGDML